MYFEGLAQEIYEALLKEDIEVTLEEVQAEVDKINIQELIDAEKEKYEIIIWDKVSPINNIPAERYLNRPDAVNSDQIYYINDKESGKTVIFQPHDPFKAGFVAMTPAYVDQISKLHLNQFVNMIVYEDIFIKVFNSFLEK